MSKLQENKFLVNSIYILVSYKNTSLKGIEKWIGDCNSKMPTTFFYFTTVFYHLLNIRTQGREVSNYIRPIYKYLNYYYPLRLIMSKTLIYIRMRHPMKI